MTTSREQLTALIQTATDAQKAVLSHVETLITNVEAFLTKATAGEDFTAEAAAVQANIDALNAEDAQVQAATAEVPAEAPVEAPAAPAEGGQ